MQTDELQPIVDALASELRRSVAIDDPNIRLIAASRHFGDEDAMRVESVLNRTVPQEIVRTVLDTGIGNWRKPGRLVIDSDPPVKPRVCVPVRCHDMLLGFLWLIDHDHSLTDHDIDLAGQTAEKAGHILYRRLLFSERSRTRNEAILRELVSSDPVMRRHAAGELLNEQLLVDPGRLIMLAAQVVSRPGGPRHDIALESAVEDSIRKAPERSTLALVHGHNAIVLLTVLHRASRSMADGVVERLVSRFKRQVGGGVRLVVGVGTEVSGLERAVDTHRQAMIAARAARLLPGLGDTLHWAQLGPYELLLRLPEEDVLAAIQVPALEALERNDSQGVLRTTLEAYLDNAGDVRRTAEELCVHRATLYHRLNRIEQLSGADLSDGLKRLTLHLALKLARLAGAYRAEAQGAGE